MIANTMNMKYFINNAQTNVTIEMVKNSQEIPHNKHVSVYVQYVASNQAGIVGEDVDMEGRKYF
jgi:hypothetical protein